MLEPLRLAGSGLERLNNWPASGDLQRLCDNAAEPLINKSGNPICFSPQSDVARPVREFTQQYEPRVYLAGEVQTRMQNWHDLFNALVWITFPRTKATLNQLHYHALLQQRNGEKVQRGALRDAATLLDESGVIVVSSDAGLVKLLQDFEWKKLFWRKRESVCAHMKFFLFGHGLYEKALKPYTGMTGKGIILPVEQDYFSRPLAAQLAAADSMLDNFLSSSLVVPAILTPVPLLGYPSWAPDNADAAYYDNRNYFRPRLQRAADDVMSIRNKAVANGRCGRYKLLSLL